MEKIFELLAVVLSAYIIGSIPTGYIIVKAFTGQDIRTIGSGSTGATNVKRVMGKKWFLLLFYWTHSKELYPLFWQLVLQKHLQELGFYRY